ncbi:hypothetical protein [Mucilaginibacter aquariorum]|uniref:Novel STAND NTPase 5 domain-containing protein n=1 Tax=Mucilaginibacter aquariorum TaxID=2967225 RepID=A0ABT1T6M4_9SPHI|nr:hypothetical protein [Mucilaginibacter aquariorum]MCQ6960112.1 hypothetical protein [Mucilaginibacter aquariorum]
MSKKQHKKKPAQPVAAATKLPIDNLNAIADKRTGGAINISGITYQTLYATYTLLKEFAGEYSDAGVRLEGLEDIDLNKGRLDLNGQELIQLKSSINSLDAAGFVEMGVLRNFLEVYRLDKAYKYRFVYNMNIAAGNLESLVAQKLKGNSLDYWQQKIGAIAKDIPDFRLEDFLARVSFEKVTAEMLFTRSVSLLLDKYKVNPGTELQYLKSIFYLALEWSKDRSSVNHRIFWQAMQQVTDAFYKGPINQAVVNGWIVPVKFLPDTNTDAAAYFDGKAARPEHITSQLPARRPVWERHLQEQLERVDVALIKSSSGQGKSTLAWQTAFNLTPKYTVYQLLHVQLAEYTEPIVDFIKSRVQIGESPLIVLDGLDQQLQHWTAVVLRLTAFPVKFLLTAREEDWYSFSNDLSKINIQITNIALKEDEAKSIYQQLKEKKKVHVGNKNWQTSWEQIREKGLLIEFTYLLTKGEMIAERLTAQIKKLNAEGRNSAAKIEMLRMIGFADILGIRLKSKTLLKHIQDTTGISGDRGELLKELELEYFVKFGEQYVEGLHPVRSAHLVKLLHEYVAAEDSLMSLLGIIGPEYYAQFAVGALDHVSDKQQFLKNTAEIIAGKRLIDMIAVIDGLMKREPQLYWEKNKETFDKVFENGGLEVFIADTLPFMQLNMIARLLESFGDEYKNPSTLLDNLMALSKYNFQDSDVASFIQLLEIALGKKEISERDGLSRLLKWIDKTEHINKLSVNITEADLLNAMEGMDLAAADELFYYLRATQPARYKSFATLHKNNIFSWLKRATDTVSVEEQGNNLHLQYVHDPDKDKLNEQSVARIEVFHSFFPDYDEYHTDLIYLPFPNEQIFKVTRMDAHKEMPAKNLFDPFEVQINQTWSRTILKNYEAESVYDWQNEFIALRKTLLEFTKRCTQFAEFLIENNEARKKPAVQHLIQVSNEALTMIRTRKRFPDQSSREEDALFKKQYREIDEWVLGSQNFINQFSLLVLKEPNQHLTLINLRKMVLKLANAQRGFHDISGENNTYFTLNELENEETTWYWRLRATVEYFEKFRDTSVNAAKAAVSSWWANDQTERPLILQEGLRIIGEKSPYNFLPPSAINEDEYGRTAAIGVIGLPEDPVEMENQLFEMIWTLVPLSSLDILTYDLIIVRERKASGGVRVQQTYLEKLLNLNDTGEFEPSEFGNPIPINLEPETVALLPGVFMPDISGMNLTQDFSKTITALWQLQQYRTFLDPAKPVEQQWFDALEQDYRHKVDRLLSQLEETEKADCETLAPLYEQIFNTKAQVPTSLFVDTLMKKVLDINEQIFQQNGTSGN